MLSLEDIKDILRIPLIGVIPESETVLQASNQGLECLNQRGSFGQLRLYNRPAILMLSDNAGTSHQVVLTALDDDHATVQLGGNSHETRKTKRICRKSTKDTKKRKLIF